MKKFVSVIVILLEKSFKIGNCSIHILDVSRMKFEVENYIEYLES